MSEYGVPGIGRARAEKLRLANIADRDAFLDASQQEISAIGDPQILKIWLQQQSERQQFGKMTELDAAKLRCEVDLARKLKRTVGEINEPIERMAAEKLPASCISEEVRLLLMDDQQYPRWRQYLAEQVALAREILNREAIEASSAKPGTSKYVLISTDNNIFFADKEGWEALFPRAKETRLIAVSDTVGALLQALTHSRPVPTDMMLRSIADQLRALANKEKLDFLRFLADDYDDYPSSLKPFVLSQLVNVHGKTTSSSEALQYFLQHAVEPLAADVGAYLNLPDTPKILQQSPEILASLYIHALRTTDETKRNNLLRELNSNASSLPSNLTAQWQQSFREMVLENALKRRATNTFNLLMGLHKAYPFQVSPHTPINSDWARIIANEKFPLERLDDLKFEFDISKVDPNAEPLYEQMRSALDHSDALAKLATVLKDPTRDSVLAKHILRGDVPLTSEEDWLWALEMTQFVGEAEADKLWKLSTSPYKELFDAIKT